MFSLGGGHGGAKDLIDRVQIHRHAEYGIVDRGLYLVVITSHVTETVDVLPDPFVVGMEDVWSVSMDQHIGFMAFGEAVATNVRASVEDRDRMPGLGQLASNHCTGETRSSNPDQPAHG